MVHAAVMLRSAVRNQGVHMVTCECSCTNVFGYHTDGDFVVCPNCMTAGRWRESGTPVPPGFEAAPLMRSARSKDDETEQQAADDDQAVGGDVDAGRGREDDASIQGGP
jgi:hypothetical protein